MRAAWRKESPYLLTKHPAHQASKTDFASGVSLKLNFLQKMAFKFVYFHFEPGILRILNIQRAIILFIQIILYLLKY